MGTECNLPDGHRWRDGGDHQFCPNCGSRRPWPTVSMDYRVPIVIDERVPRGMAWIGYDADGRLVYTVNLGDPVEPEQEQQHEADRDHERENLQLG